MVYMACKRYLGVCGMTCTREMYRGIIDLHVNWILQIRYEMHD